MRLFIAEKPTVAKAIAAELGVTGKGEGYLECGADKVTWCFGHMLEQAGPDEYTPDDVPRTKKGKKIWRVDELPIIPTEWIRRPKDDAKKQVRIIGSLMKSATQIVNAGDPDREGQLLVDELLEHFKIQKPVTRYWSNAIDPVSVRRALASLKSNEEFKGFAAAADGRGKADWLIGMNLSRAYTLRASRAGSRSLLTVGRVQTPTLSLVVNRDREIESFKSIPFHTIRVDVQHPAGSFQAKWEAGEDQAGLDADGRLIDTAIADALVSSLTGQQGSIADYKQETKKQNHPLTFSLSDMTALASKRFGYSAEEILNTCQSLYETHKLTTYPRTDCAYLPESQLADAPDVLSAIKLVNPELSNLVDRADTTIKSRTWNDKKVSAHHGIIPTLHAGDVSRLNDKERNIYALIVRGYLAQFYPMHEFMKTTVSVVIGDEEAVFSAKGNVVIKSGWHEVYTDEPEEEGDSQEEEKQTLPAMKNGDAISCINAVRRDAKTKPPSRFTEGTLITAMVNVHRFVTNPQHKKILREGDGIGTEATRASILSELKRREYLEAKGKQIVSTTLGRSMIDALPEVVKSPVLTALYERMLKGVETGEAALGAFIEKQEAFIREQVQKANEGSVKIAGGKEAASVSTLHKCMACGAGLSRRPSRKKGQFWWGCSNYPTCTQVYPDVKGLPNYSQGRKRDDKKAANQE